MLQILVRFLILVLSLTVVLSCSKTPSKSLTPQGGQDVGGGDTLGSSEEEVRFAVQSAIVAIQDIYGYENIKLNPLRQIIQSLKNTDLEPVAKKIFFPVGWLEHDNIVRQEFSSIEEYFNQKFKKGRIVWKQSGACSAENSRHTDASVSAHQNGADVCISIENLKSIPRESIFKEVIGLLIHESAHLEGFKEKEAVKIQKKISEELSRYKTYYSLGFEQEKIKNNLKNALDNVNQMKELFEKDANHPILVTHAYEALISLTLEMEYFRNPTFFRGAIGQNFWKLSRSIDAAVAASDALYTKFSGNTDRPQKPFSQVYIYDYTFHLSHLKLDLELPKDKLLNSVANVLEFAVNQMERNFPQIELVGDSATSSLESEDAWLAFTNASSVFQAITFFDDDLNSPIPEIEEELAKLELNFSGNNIFKTRTLSLLGEKNIGSFLFKKKINVLKNGSCPKVDTEIDHPELCVELERISGLPKELRFKKALEIIVELAIELKVHNREDKLKIQNEFNKKLETYVTYLDPHSAALQIRKNLVSALSKVTQLESSLAKAPDKKLNSVIVDETILDLTHRMPDFRYPHFFKGAVGGSYAKFQSTIKSNLAAWVQLYSLFVLDDTNIADENELRTLWFLGKYTLHNELIQDQLSGPESLNYVKSNLEQALQELDKNFPEK